MSAKFTPPLFCLFQLYDFFIVLFSYFTIWQVNLYIIKSKIIQWRKNKQSYIQTLQKLTKLKNKNSSRTFHLTLVENVLYSGRDPNIKIKEIPRGPITRFTWLQPRYQGWCYFSPEISSYLYLNFTRSTKHALKKDCIYKNVAAKPTDIIST